MDAQVVPMDRSSRAFSWELASEVGSIAEARHAFEQWLGHHAVDPRHCADLVVVLSELAANAVAAADGANNGPIAVRSWRTEDDVVLEVENPPQDRAVAIAVPADGDPLRSSGRGLLIVAAYTDTVEVIPADLAKGLTVRCRKQVWSESGQDVVAEGP